MDKDLADRLDFNTGLSFQEDIWHRFRSPVHHPSPSPVGSFLLLATFWRFLFRLTEESVALALESCLGGHASDFHVQFLSNNHFRFSVFSKEVGFQIYKLRRITTQLFDVYFHLWNNGTPHWEKEKCAWEIEQEEEWTRVYSKREKRSLKKQENSQKRVRFAKKLVQSPKINNPLVTLNFGSFKTKVDPSSPSSFQRCVFAPSSKNSSSDRVRASPRVLRDSDGLNDPELQAQSLDPISNSILRKRCSRCLSPEHSRWACSSEVRCRVCFTFGRFEK